MNNQKTTDGRTFRNYPGTLDFYHPTSKGTGSVVRFELKPARNQREGCFFMEMASQKTVTTRDQSGTRRAATFDWPNKITVKLGVTDICQLLLVLQGQQQEVCNGKGLFHDTSEASTVIRLRRSPEHTGLALEVSRKTKEGDSKPIRLRLVLTEAEALGLTLIFEQSMLLLVYGLLTREPETMQPTP